MVTITSSHHKQLITKGLDDALHASCTGFTFDSFIGERANNFCVLYFGELNGLWEGPRTKDQTTPKEATAKRAL
jgi:hypothetical protein